MYHFESCLWSCTSSLKGIVLGSGRAGRLRRMGKYIGHHLVAQELDNTFLNDSILRICFRLMYFWTVMKCRMKFLIILLLR